MRPVYEVGDRLGYVHIGENHRGYLGSGHLDFTSLLPRAGRHRLHRADHLRVLLLGGRARATLSNDLAIWRNLWDDGADLARHAHQLHDRPAPGQPAAVTDLNELAARARGLLADRAPGGPRHHRRARSREDHPGGAPAPALRAAPPEGTYGEDWVAHVPMDGFHLADVQLDRLGLRHRKGAPETFDAAGYRSTADAGSCATTRPRPSTHPGSSAVLEQPVAAAIAVPPEARLILTEGNYLLHGGGRVAAGPRHHGGGLVRRPPRPGATGPTGRPARRIRQDTGRRPGVGPPLGRGQRRPGARPAILSRPRRQPLSTPKGDPEAVRNQALRSATLHPTWQSTVWSSACVSARVSAMPRPRSSGDRAPLS